MGRLRIHFRAVRILVAQNVAGEFNHHHLHAQTDSKRRNILSPAILRRHNLALDASLTEARTDNDARHAL